MIISSTRLIKILLFIVVILAFLHLVLIHLMHFTTIEYVWKLRRFFHLNWEISFASYFSSAILAFSSVLLYITSRQDKPRHVYWKFLSVLFLLLSLDEALAFHEELVDPLRSLIGEFAFLYHAWLILAIPAVTVLGIFLYRFIFSLPRPLFYQMLLAAAFYLGGAVGLEIVAGYYEYTNNVEESYILDWMILFEESFEMIGVIIFIRVLLHSPVISDVNLNFNFSSGTDK